MRVTILARVNDCAEQQGPWLRRKG